MSRLVGDRLFRVEIRSYTNGVMNGEPNTRFYRTYSQFIKWYRTWASCVAESNEAMTTVHKGKYAKKLVVYQFDDATDEWQRWEPQGFEQLPGQ